MKVTLPCVNYYDRNMVSSVDFCNLPDAYRLVTAGVTPEVRLWSVAVEPETGTLQVEYRADLVVHNSTVNIVRFSPSGRLLASGDVNASLVVWHQETQQPSDSNGEQDPAKGWRPLKKFACHVAGTSSIATDLVDLCWLNCDDLLATASLNGTVMTWSMVSSKPLCVFHCDDTLPKGISYIPDQQRVVVLCEDKTMRFFHATDNDKKPLVVRRAKLAVAGSGQDEQQHAVSLFVGHQWSVINRRPAVSPDSTLLVTPCGSPSQLGSCCSYIFLTTNPRRPVAMLPTENLTTAVRFCPIPFELKNKDGRPLIKLPAAHRFVFAVVSQRQVLLYDTEQSQPIAGIENVHYANVTDLAWSPDGRLLCMSSCDGYLSFCAFEPDELGTPTQLAEPQQPTTIQPNATVAEALPEKKVPQKTADVAAGTLLQYFGGQARLEQPKMPERRRIETTSIVD